MPLFAVGTVGLVPVDGTNRWADGFRAVVLVRRREARSRRFTPPPDACTQFICNAILLAKQDGPSENHAVQQLKVGGVCLHAWQDGELEEIIKRSRSEVAIRYATFPMLVLLKRMLLYPHLVGREVQEVYLSRIYIYTYSYIYIHIYIYIYIPYL